MHYLKQMNVIQNCRRITEKVNSNGMQTILLFQIIASDLRPGQYKMHTADYRLQIR